VINPEEMADLEMAAGFDQEADDPAPHRCKVDTTTKSPFYPGHPGYQAVCDHCGPVGVAESDGRDAQAIANRHEEIGGFER
jgi:hypothetical protein